MNGRRSTSRGPAGALAAAAVAALVCGATPTLAAPPAPARKPTVEVFGDRYGTLLAVGLTETDPGVAIAYATNDVATLSGPGYADWLRLLRERLARPQKPDIAVMMVGERDHGPLVEGATRIDPGTPAWSAALASRIDAVAKLFAEAHVPLVWVGLPPVRSQDGSADASRIDGVLRDRAAADGARFVDIWSGFTDDQGRYSPDGPDAQGNAARLRRGEGFTQAGMHKLASYVVPELDRLAGRTAAPGSDPANITIERARDFDAALSVDVNAQIRREAARAASGAPARPVVPSGPAAGPIVSLTSPSAPAGADLVALPPDGSPLPAAQTADATPSEPAPGRADDFSWPKPGGSP